MTLYGNLATPCLVHLTQICIHQGMLLVLFITLLAGARYNELHIQKEYMLYTNQNASTTVKNLFAV